MRELKNTASLEHKALKEAGPDAIRVICADKTGAGMDATSTKRR